MFNFSLKVNVCKYVSIAAVFLQACAYIPELGIQGSGGKAEVHQGTFLAISARQPVKTAHILRLDWESQKHLLDLLILQGADRCYPASVQIANERQTRIVRELVAGMVFDASNNLLIQREQLARLEVELNFVNRFDTCYPDSDSPPPPLVTNGDASVRSHDSLTNEIMQLLNSDNQFPLNSSEINPKYQNRLITAAALLIEVGDYILMISGHADERGLEPFNMTLSQKRSEAVSQFLVLQGLAESAIIEQALGESNPLFAGNSDAIHLVNRRVNIRLLTENTQRIGR